jgi:hypothetical protein
MSKRSSSSKTSQRKSIPKEDENISISDQNEPGSLSMFSSVKMRYFEDSENEEENDDVGDFGLQIESSSNQLKYKYLGKIFAKTLLRCNRIRFNENRDNGL